MKLVLEVRLRQRMSVGELLNINAGLDFKSRDLLERDSTLFCDKHNAIFKALEYLLVIILQ